MIKQCSYEQYISNLCVSCNSSGEAAFYSAQSLTKYGEYSFAVLNGVIYRYRDTVANGVSYLLHALIHVTLTFYVTVTRVKLRGY